MARDGILLHDYRYSFDDELYLNYKSHRGPLPSTLFQPQYLSPHKIYVTPQMGRSDRDNNSNDNYDFCFICVDKKQ